MAHVAAHGGGVDYGWLVVAVVALGEPPPATRHHRHALKVGYCRQIGRIGVDGKADDSTFVQGPDPSLRTRVLFSARREQKGRHAPRDRPSSGTLASQLSVPAACSGAPRTSRRRLPRHRVVVLCDGVFWHGRDLEDRVARLERGHNAEYHVAKVRRNVERDREQTRLLETSGWVVMRIWEKDVLLRTADVTEQIADVLRQHQVV